MKVYKALLPYLLIDVLGRSAVLLILVAVLVTFIPPNGLTILKHILLCLITIVMALNVAVMPVYDRMESRPVKRNSIISPIVITVWIVLGSLILHVNPLHVIERLISALSFWSKDQFMVNYFGSKPFYLWIILGFCWLMVLLPIPLFFKTKGGSETPD